MLQRLLKISILLFGFLFFIPTQARHIIGGEISYQCLGNDNYQFSLIVYRDCNCGNCAYFDAIAPIGIYKCGNDIDCSSFDQTSVYTTVSAALGVVTQIPIDTSCLFSPDICVEEGRYTFTANLPQGPESYYISYQRCCRNETISNINIPANTGATHSIEITPLAQLSCNSSPVFNTFPPIVIYPDQALMYDHSATDPDGDSLSYKFCSPLNGGGGFLDQDNYNSCVGAAPSPACPPPYNEITFKTGFSSLEPLAGNPVISIDAISGLITGTPELIGQYVVGVCVQEYRNGILIGSFYRDFQFNVTTCGTTSLQDIVEESGIKIFPNPANQSIQVFLSKQFDKNEKWQLFSYSGAMLIDKQILPFQNTLDVNISHLPTGLYFWRLQSKDGTTESGKLVVER